MTLAEVVAKSGEAAKSGPIGLALILVLCIVCYFLFKSMSKHLRKVREEFPGQSPTQEQPQPPASTPTQPPAQPRASTSAQPPASTPAQPPASTPAEPPAE